MQLISTLIWIIGKIIEYIVRFIDFLLNSALLQLIEFLMSVMGMVITVAYRVMHVLWAGLIRFARWGKYVFQAILRLFNAYIFTPIWTRVLPYLKVIWAHLKSIWNGIKGIFNAIVNPFLEFINRAWTAIKPYVEPIIQYMRGVVVWIRENIVIRYLMYVARIVDYFATIRLVARAVREVKKGNVAGAIWALAKLVDEKTASAIESTIARVTNEIENLRNAIMDTVYDLQDDLYYVYDRTLYIEDTLDLMYEAFGIPAIGDLKEKVKQFREKVIEEVIKAVDRFGAWIQNQFAGIIHPIYNVYQQIYTMIWAFQEEERLAKAMKYIPYRDGLIPVQSVSNVTILVPRRVSTMILGR